MSDSEEIERHIKELFNIFNKQFIKKDSEMQGHILSLIKCSELNPKYKVICTSIVENLKMSQ